MPASSIRLRHTLLGGLCASALVMGACSGGDKAPAEEITVEAASLELSQADETALSRHFQVAPRGGDEATTLQHLAALGLGQTDAMAGERVIDGSTVRYTDWATTTNDGSYTADTVSFIGLHAVDGETSFDKMIVTNFAAADFEGEGDDRVQVADARVGELTVVSPTPELADALAQLVLGQDGADVFEGDAAEELVDTGTFKALHLKDMIVNVTDEGDVAKVTLGQIVIGNDTADERVDLVVEDIDFDWQSNSGPNGQFALKMDGMTALGVDVSGPAMGMPAGGAPTNLFAGMLSPSTKLPYRQIDLGTVDFKSAMFDLQMEGLEADSEVNGPETILRSVFAPMTVSIKDVAGTPVAPYMDVLRKNGLDVITFKGSQTMTLNSRTDKMTVTDARVEIDEGLRTRCDYTLEGIQAAATALEESGVEMPVLELDEIEDREAVINEYFEGMQAYNEAQAAANGNIKIAGLSCDIQDVPGNSLVERGYKVASEITGSPVGVLKGSAKTAIALGSMMAPSEFERDMMDIVGSGLIDFIDNPGQTLRIRMTPEEPVAITSLTGQDGAEPTIKPLNLTVEVE